MFPRMPGVAATRDQIDISCRNVDTQIYNGDFEIVGIFDDVPEPSGWGLTSIGDASVFALLDPSQHTFGGAYFARFYSTMLSGSAQLVQPLTLCPGTTYALSVWTRQLNPLDVCTAAFSIEGELLGVVNPTANWTNSLSDSAPFTAGPNDADASVDLTITLSCAGRGASTVVRLLDLDDVSLVALL
jgi:hypothetical protein